MGCGGVKLRGYINVDIDAQANTDVIANIEKLPFREGSASIIYNCAILEHFGRKTWKSILRIFYDTLKPGGLLLTSTNNFEAACVQYQENKNIEEILGLLIGGQKSRYDWHGMIFDFNTLKNGLLEVGFTNIKRYDWRDTDVGLQNIDDYSQAYLPHMDKQNGRLMMLNVTAERPL